jgi:flagellar hook-associated protein 1 FlgK
MGIEIGKRAAGANRQGLDTVGHNLSNASTEGYSRQRVHHSPFEPIYLPGLNREETAGQIGQGVIVGRIERVRDQLLDQRIIAQAGGEGYWGARDPYISMMEQAYLEVGDSSLRGSMDAFWEAWQELSVYPTDTAPRQAVLSRGQTLIDSIHDRFKALRGLQDMAEQDIRITTSQVNEYSRQIAALNKDIERIRAHGDNPNDLMDRRDLLVDKLSGLIDITVDRRDPDEFMIHTGGFILVQGKVGREFNLERIPGQEGRSRIVWPETGEPVQFKSGSLAALMELRDHTIEDEIQSLDSMTMNFIDLVNEVHSAGWGLNGTTGLNFFNEHPFVTDVNGNYDRNGDGAIDSSYIFRITGGNVLEPRAQPGLEGTITLSGPDPAGNIEVQYYATDTVQDIVTRINNSGAEVVARLDRDGHLSLKGTPAEGLENPDFVIRHIEDNGRDGAPGYFLSDYAGVLRRGEAYDWAQQDAAAALAVEAPSFAVAPVANPSGWIEINNLLFRDPSAIAAGFGENGRAANPGNGEAALAIAAIRNTDVMVGRLGTFDDYFADAVGRIGLLGEQSETGKETQGLIMKQLRDMRDSISGVNIDEELAEMIKYQHGYAAAARFITTVNDMLDTIINRMGV